ncbi:hypothetical protein C7379_10217 [Hallella colorans]|uniref:Uncharacterized protein n=1 Tax=Hallella colorans TaxID=1703337 RepID=A0A2U0ULH7_9BACT|nr:hypothetical protein C7379_10217 [Hallella colorans]
MLAFGFSTYKKESLKDKRPLFSFSLIITKGHQRIFLVVVFLENNLPHAMLAGAKVEGLRRKTLYFNMFSSSYKR